jgi:hypothetical protein
MQVYLPAVGDDDLRNLNLILAIRDLIEGKRVIGATMSGQTDAACIEMLTR